jgi:hypothetical protein
MVRFALCLVLAAGACAPAQAPTARRVGKVMSIGGVAGLIGASAFSGSEYTRELVFTFSLTSAIGIGLYAAGDLSGGGGYEQVETIPARNHRWAKILTQRAAGAARDGRCPRVRRLEVRVRTYDREVHDFVFMRDPEILKCMTLSSQPLAPESAP